MDIKALNITDVEFNLSLNTKHEQKSSACLLK